MSDTVEKQPDIMSEPARHPDGDKKNSFTTRRQVGQMIRQAFERRGIVPARHPDGKVFCSPPNLEDLEDGQEVEVDLYPGQVEPAEPVEYERRRYVRRGQRLFFFVMKEVK